MSSLTADFSLKSETWDTEITIAFTNETGDVMNIYWVDYDGNEDSRGPVENGATFY
jgi:hypothetical protein